MAGRAATDRVIQGACAISVNDPGHPLPVGWRRVRLTDVAELGTGHTPSRNHPAYWDGGIGWVGIRDAGACHGKVIHETAQNISHLGLAKSAARLLPKGTVCLSRTASVGYVVKLGREMATSQDFVTWTCGHDLDPDFLMKALLAEGPGIRRFGEGSTHTTIYFPKVKAFHIDLPPLAEQRRIVTKLDTLTARLSRASAELDRVAILAKEMKRACLEFAFGPDGLQATTLTTTVGEVSAISSGYGFPKEMQGKANGDYPFAKVSDISRAVLNKRGELKHAVNYVDKADLKTLRARPVAMGSTVFAKIGEALHLNRRALAYCDLVLDNNCMALSPSSATLPEYLYLFMRTVNLSSFAVATAVPSVRRSDVANLRMPLPSLGKQAQIISTVQAALARTDRMEAEAARARAMLSRLEAAILARAFRGELVPQDPEDEPASVLLARIHNERAAAPRARRGRRVSVPA